MVFILQLLLLRVIIVSCIKNTINNIFLLFVYLYIMGDFDLMPGSTKGGPPKRTVYYQYSGPGLADETIKKPTPTDTYDDTYIDDEMDYETKKNSKDTIDIKKFIIIGAVIFIIILIIIVSIIVYIVMKNKNNNKNNTKNITNNKNNEKIKEN